MFDISFAAVWYKLPNCHPINPSINALTSVPKNVIMIYFLRSNRIKPLNALIAMLGIIGTALTINNMISSERLFSNFFSAFSISSQETPKYLPQRSKNGFPAK